MQFQIAALAALSGLAAAAPQNAGDGIVQTVTTFTTQEVTITSCAPTVTFCPASVTTTSFAVVTTIPLVIAINANGVPSGVAGAAGATGTGVAGGAGGAVCNGQCPAGDAGANGGNVRYNMPAPTGGAAGAGSGEGGNDSGYQGPSYAGAGNQLVAGGAAAAAAAMVAAVLL